jgi:hypothetical protein
VVHDDAIDQVLHVVPCNVIATKQVAPFRHDRVDWRAMTVSEQSCSLLGARHRFDRIEHRVVERLQRNAKARARFLADPQQVSAVVVPVGVLPIDHALPARLVLVARSTHAAPREAFEQLRLRWSSTW